MIDAPLPEVAAFLKKVENNLTWDKFLVVSTYECRRVCNGHFIPRSLKLKSRSPSPPYPWFEGAWRNVLCSNMFMCS